MISATKSVGKDETVAGPQPPCALRISPPRAAAGLHGQCNLDRSLPAPADEPRRNDLGVVEHEQVARTQQLRQIANPPVEQPAGRGQDQQPGGVARLGRMVRDQLAW